MAVVGMVLSLAFIFLVLLDWFEATLLPRRVTRPYRYARFYYRTTWAAWKAASRFLGKDKHRETFLSFFGPLSLLGLLATWVVGLILGFALLFWSLSMTLQTPAGERGLPTYLYLSGVTFFTLGYGDVTPAETMGRFLVMVEAGLGYAFLAVVIGYMPVLYQAFSKREVTISLLDARAGSPPSAAQLLVRSARAGGLHPLDPLLTEWERWAAELLESHLSFPMLSYYRSQHDNQSWVAAVTVMLDTCTLLIAGLKENDKYQAQLTFAMARHAVVDLAMIFHTPPQPPAADRLPVEDLQLLRQELKEAGVAVREGSAIDAKQAELRGMYEPFVNALAQHFQHDLPSFCPEPNRVDNWQTSAWMRRAPGISKLPLVEGRDDHFD